MRALIRQRLPRLELRGRQVEWAPPRPPGSSTGRSRLALDAARLAWLAPYFPVALVLGGLALLLYAAGSATIVQDSWSTLVAGREIARSGLPSVDHLTVLGSGHRWTDQQWLAQLVLYGIEAAGGLKAVVLAGAAAAALAYGIVLVSVVRRTRVSPTVVTLFAALAVAGAPWAFQVRAQELALPLGAAVFALLLADPDARRRRTLLVLPLLAVWANVHGSVVLGAAIVCLYGLTVLVAGPRRGRERAVRAAPFLALSPLAVLASPYGPALIGYYRLLLVHPPFRGLIQEWETPHPSPYTAPFFVLATLAVAFLIFGIRRLTAFEALLLLVMLVPALNALHNTVWFSLAALAVLPGHALRPRRAASRSVGAAFAVVAAVALIVVCAVAAAAPRSHYAPHLGSSASRAVASALNQAGGKIYADDAHADWVLWKVAGARGRVLYDSRIELVHRSDIEKIAYLQAVRGDYERTLAGVNLIVVEPAIAARFRQAHWGRLVYADDWTVVLARKHR
jgi:hypothetical protein